ncbi:uncharacterized protein LOC131425398 [Malaya genurostris]|uniref:uncharacterized protein LOC131425398 n=1 Tax=Malaya genurostris TaxID=325434 RepID=UPI0026F39067|nr:uncharacterized protein LOC131425398 [Malaya genurostris]
MFATVFIVLTTVIALVDSISISPDNNHHHYGGGGGSYGLQRYAAPKGAGRLPFLGRGGVGGEGGGGRHGTGSKGPPPPRLTSRVDNAVLLSNQTADRNRRLIPYMTFYIPSSNGDFSLPINQAYNYMPIRPHRPQEQSQPHHYTSAKLPIMSLQQHQRQPQQSGTGLGGDPPLLYQSYQPQNHQPSRYQSPSHSPGPIKTVLINNYPGKYEYSHRPQLPPQPSSQPPSYSGVREQNSAGLYGSRAQLPQYSQPPSKLYAVEIQPSKPKPTALSEGPGSGSSSGVGLNLIVVTPASSNYDTRSPSKYQPTAVYEKYHINPFLPSNKLPGQFTPITHNSPSSSSSAGHQQSQVGDDSEDEEEEDTRQDPRPPPPTTYTHPKSTYVLVKPSPEPNQLYYHEKPLRPSSGSSHYETYKEKPSYLQDPDVFKPVPKPVTVAKPIYLNEQEIYKPASKSQLNLLKSSYLEGPEFYKHSPKPIPVYHDEPEVYKPSPKPIPTYHDDLDEYKPVPKSPDHAPIPIKLDYTTPRAIPLPVQYSTPRPHPGSIKYNTQPSSTPAPPSSYSTTVRPKFSVRQKPTHKHSRGSTKAPSLRQHLTENTNPSEIRSPSPSYYDHYSDYKSYVKQSYYSSTQPNYIPASDPSKTTRLVLASQDLKPRPVYQHHKPRPVTPSSILETASASGSTSLADLLKKLQDSNHLPKTLTPDNIDNSIRTLVKILNNLKATQQIHKPPSQTYPDQDYDYRTEVRPSKPNDENDDYDDSTTTGHVMPLHPELGKSPPGPNSGRPGVDYPNLSKIPETSFSCKEQRYKGFFGDPETNCQVWHYCDLNGGKASFLCPNGTIFSQVALTCDWWFNVKCSTTAQLYVLNERLYKYILPFTPKFPEDYSGPLVDKYLAIKFQEMEDKMKKQRAKGKPVVQPSLENENDELNGNKLEDNDDRYNQNQPHPIQYVTENSIETTAGSASVSTPVTLEDINADFERTGKAGDDLSEESGGGSLPIVVTAPSAPSSSTGAEDDAIDSEKASVTALSSVVIDGMPHYVAPQSPESMRPYGAGVIHSQREARIEVKHDGTSGHLTPAHGYVEKRRK